VDILKVKGYKISALEIERVLLEEGNVEEVAVFGRKSSDPAIGDEIVAVLVPKRDCALDVERLKQFLKGKLAHYKVPTLFKLMTAIPRNSMGKVDKKALKQSN
jgi:malonyl-CoA/methylmalonyl-CoA synthetase